MSRSFLAICPLIVSVTLVVSSTVKASEAVEKTFIFNEQSTAEVTPVSQLSDVQPADWTFVALQSLIERYKCIAENADNTYRGNQALTRYEFAAGLNACINTINQQQGNQFSQLAQADITTIKPGQNLELGLTYLRNYSPDGNLLHRTGSDFANIPFGAGVPLVSNAYGVEGLWRVTPKMAVSGWFGYINADRVDSVDGDADIINYAVNLAFPDLFKDNAVGGLGFGMPPKVINNTIDNREDKGTGLHFEAFYQYPLTENITVIPGIILLTNSNHSNANGDIFIGTIRTVFNF